MLRFVVLLLALFIAPAPADARDYCEGNLCFQKKARVACLRPEVWSLLHKLASRIGRLEVTSGCDGRHARRSHHHTGSAVDFRPMQASQRVALVVMRSMPEVGGIGVYSNGLLHADIREQRVSWSGRRKPQG